MVSRKEPDQLLDTPIRLKQLRERERERERERDRLIEKGRVTGKSYIKVEYLLCKNMP